MTNKNVLKKIREKQKELNQLVDMKNYELQDKKVYEKSCELDRLIVEYMKNYRQVEIIFP